MCEGEILRERQRERERERERNREKEKRKKEREREKNTMRDTKRKRGSFEPVDVVVEFHFINLILDCEHLFDY